VTDPIQSRGTDLQRHLSDFLYGEMLHTLGAYQLACDRLQQVHEELGKGAVERRLDQAVLAAYRCNDHLRNGLHRPVEPNTPGPALGRRPSPFLKRPQFPREGLLKKISNFYVDAELALTLHRDGQGIASGPNPPAGNTLGAKLAFIHDPQRRGGVSEIQPEALIQGKIDRTRTRLEAVHLFLPGERLPPRPAHGTTPSRDRTRSIQRTLDGHAGKGHSLLLTIIEALSEAHMWMHEAEHIHAQSFGPMFSSIPKTHAEAQAWLRYSVTLNTFVFVAARAVPWIFAEDKLERDHVLDKYEDCCSKLAPTYCMWIAAELSLIALHRRAFTWWTMGKVERAYRDFHKLTRLLRGLRKPAEKRGLRVPGTKTFIEGMTGISELHIGRIYRGQHSHRMALQYFDRGSRHLKGWERHEEIGEVMKNSGWRINLLLNQGKSNYELGHIKRSILYYARAWRAFLLLVETETHATANVDVVERVIKWLAPVVDDPEMSREELRARIVPLVEQFETLRSPVHLRLLAADIVMRMGHILYILRLPWQDAGGDETPRNSHDLALRCATQASKLDPTSTLAAADRLRIEQERGLAPDEIAKNEAPLSEHWPSGSGYFEAAARITEYTLQRSLVSAGGGDPSHDSQAEVAQKLLGAFLAHTDSSNVKLAQVYRYLMKEGQAKKRETDPREHTLDFVCMRRYASFFPFLPRPSAFRAPGGGYFVQAREAGEKMEPFGIAIDPGPDYIENLYRCGYALADIQMIVLTHDHADHIASLDALLALMEYRKRLGDDTFDRKEGKRLLIVGNESVCERYAFFGEPRPVIRREHSGPPRLDPVERGDAVRVMSFEEIARITAINDEKARAAAVKEAEILPMPDTLRLEPVRSWGHADAHGHIAQAFMLGFGPDGDRCSILFTGDTGTPPAPDAEEDDEKMSLLAKGSKSLWEAAEEADVIVAHLSSVPLRELRKLAGLGEGASTNKTITEYKRIWARAAARANSESEDEDTQEGIRATEFLLNQIQFGFRSRPAGKNKDFRVSPFADIEQIREQPERHLYLTGLIALAEYVADNSKRSPLLLVGELREELGSFRTKIARHIADAFFKDVEPKPAALTTDIGLRVRLSRPAHGSTTRMSVLCTTCDLDNDLMQAERFHKPQEIKEVCVKGEDEGVFYNCPFHHPRDHEDNLWIESVERYDPFGA
jgi:hypothetical protein